MNTRTRERVIAALAADLAGFYDELLDAPDYLGLDESETETAALCACCNWLQSHVPGCIQDAVWAAGLPNMSVNVPVVTA
jgi:hypothetical protein